MAASYNNYKDLHEEAKNALNCNYEDLLGKINTIKDTLARMYLMWNDEVSQEFDAYKSSLVEILTEISNNVNENLSLAQGAYNELKQILDNFKKDYEKYIELTNYNNIPPKTITTKNESGESIAVPNLAYDEWSRNKQELENNFNSYAIDIQEPIRTLQDINGKTISTEIKGLSVQTNIPQFVLPDVTESDTSENPDDSKTTVSSLDIKPDGTRKGNAKYVWKFLKSQTLSDGTNLSDAQIAGIFGNINQENSNFKPNLKESDATQRNDSAKGYGIIQWTNYKGEPGGRRDQLFAAAKAAGDEEKARTLEFQCEYLWDEVFTPRNACKYNHSGNPDYYSKLKAAGFFNESDPAEAAQIFHNVVEGSADKDTMATRGVPARKWYSEIKEWE